MKASELQGKDATALKKELNDLLKAQIRSAHAGRDPAATKHFAAEKGSS